jgi:transposase
MAWQVIDGATPDVPADAAKVISMLSQQALGTHAQVQEIDRALVALQRSDDMARRLSTIPGIGPVGATALTASVTDPASSAPVGSSRLGSG